MQESSGTYNIRDHSLDTVHLMIDYLYTGDYGIELPGQEAPKSNNAGKILSVHAKTFALADQYLIHGLKTLSVEKYRAAFAAHGTIFNFLDTIMDIYTLTPDTVRELRETAVGFARQHLPKALNSVEEREAFEKVTTEVPAFAKDLLHSFLQSPCIGSCVNCRQLYRSKFRKAGT